MATLFTRIIEGELPAEFVWTDDRCVAFLSIDPLRPGHTLVVSRAEIDHWIDLDDELASHLMVVAKRIAVVQQELFTPTKVGMIIQGLEVPHVHLHVVPIYEMDDLEFSRARPPTTPEELAVTGRALREALT